MTCLFLGTQAVISQEKHELFMLNFEKAATASKLENKPLVVFLYTDWCRYCRAMEQTTFNEKHIIQSLNRDFYYVPFNAESRTTVTLNGKNFNFKPTGNKEGLHEIATALAQHQDKPTFPSLFIINSDFEIIYEASGFIDAKDLNLILKKVSSTYASQSQS